MEDTVFELLVDCSFIAAGNRWYFLFTGQTKRQKYSNYQKKLITQAPHHAYYFPVKNKISLVSFLTANGWYKKAV